MKTNILHIGCGPFRYDELVNTDKDEFDITKNWPQEDNSVDGIVCMAVLECLTWRELARTLSEMYRVLKPNAVLRMGVPVIESHKPLSWLLGWSNINLFSVDLLRRVLLGQIGFRELHTCGYQMTNSKFPEITLPDNRPDEQVFLEFVK